MSELYSLANGSNHNVCQYCDYNHKSECPCCTSLGFEGFTLDEHDNQIRADAINEHFAKIMSFINTNNRGNCDYFIVDQIENYIFEQLKELMNE